MAIDQILFFGDLIGVFIFALSGGLTAMRLKLDLTGVIVISSMPAIGGGTLRDLLLGQPIFWLEQEIYLLAVIIGGLTAFFAPSLWSRQRALVWFDAFGLSVFAAIGAAKAESLGHDVLIMMIMGVITATAGGLVRDVVCREIPMLLREDIYAIATILGPLTVWVAHSLGVPSSLGVLVGALMVFSTRAATILLKLKLPRPLSVGDN